MVRKIVHVRLKQRLGPAQIAGRLGVPASTVHAVLSRCRLNRLTSIDRATGEPIRRYEHDRPGAMLHVDVKKFGNIPDGGGRRYVGRVQGERNREATADLTGNRNTRYEPRLAYKSHAWRDACADLGIQAKKTRPYRPQTNGKVERFHRTLADGWALGRFHTSEQARRKALPAWLHLYNHHRPHTATNGKPPITRLTNLPGQYT
jgi:transposase InsO family protein